MSGKKPQRGRNSERLDSFAPPERVDKAAELRAQAQIGGLYFIAYLPPAFAGWLLDHIEDGLFANPKEAIFALVGHYREREPYGATREELLRCACMAMCFDDPTLTLPKGNYTEHVQNLFDTPPAKAAIWRE